MKSYQKACQRKSNRVRVQSKAGFSLTGVSSQNRSFEPGMRPVSFGIALLLALLLTIGMVSSRIEAQEATATPSALPDAQATVEPATTPPTPDPTATPSPVATAVPTPTATAVVSSKTFSTDQFSAAALGTATLPFTISLSPSATVLAGSTVTAAASWGSAPAGLPTGTMTYSAYSGTGCTGSLFASAGTNTLSGSPALLGSVAASTGVLFSASGSFSWQASYSGDASYAARSVCANLTVNAYTPTMTLTVSPASSPMKAGGTATGAVTISSASATASGTVTYTVYSNSGCTTALSISGSPAVVTVVNAVAPAAAAITFNQIGTFYWKAVYSGDGANSAASSSCVSLVVAKSTPTIAVVITASSPPMLAGGTASGLATLTGATTVAGGTVTYTVYTNNTCSTQISPAQTGSKTVAGGVAPTSDTYTYNLVGTFYWKAVYSGDADNTTASSACTSFAVAKANPTVSLALSPSTSIIAGTAVTGTATLSGYSPTAAGSMVYAVYTDSGCLTATNPTLTSTKTVAAGIPPVSTAQIHNVVGTFYWKAAYAGDTNNNAASSPCVAISVTKANPTVALTVAPSASTMIAGGTARGTATFTGITTTGSGTVVYRVYSDSGCTLSLTATGNPNSKTVSSGAVSRSNSITIPIAGFVYWNATYSGDSNNNAATSPCVALSVAKTSPTIALVVTAALTPMKVGGTATGKGTLTGALSTAGGSAVYTVYSNSTCTTTLTANNSPSTVTVTNRTVGTSAAIRINLSGTVYWRVVYSGDANNNGATSSCVAQTVAKSNPTVTLTVAPVVSPMVVGRAAFGKVTMTLIGTDAGGSLTYTVYSENTCTTTLTAPGSPSTVTVVNNVTPNSANITINRVGTVYWKASYAGDTNNNAAVSGCVAQTVAKTTPVISLSVTASTIPMVIGGTAFGSAVVSSSTTNAGGTLTYSLYSNSTCTTTAANVSATSSAVTVTNAVVPNSTSITVNFVGTLYWKAAYAGDTNNNAVSSSCVSFAIGKKQPSVTITVTPAISPMRAGGTATGAATISGSTANAGGSMVYSVFTDNACTLQVSPAQTATKTVTTAAVANSGAFTFNVVGTFYWNAAYSGDTSNNSATSLCVALNVLTVGASGVDVTVAPNPIVLRNSFNGTAVLSGTTAVAGGSVTYSIFTDAACTIALSPARTSTVTVVNSIVPNSSSFSIALPGTYYMNAAYSGDASNPASTSVCDAFAVIKASPSISLTLSPNPIVVGFSTVASASLTNASSNANGTVVYTVYSDNGCTAAVSPAVSDTQTVVTGVVASSIPLRFDNIGTYFFKATYSGDSENNPAGSNCISFSVTKASPTLTLTLSPNPATIGENFGASLSLSADGINPSGTAILTTYTDPSCSTLSLDVATYTATLSGGLIPDAPPAFLTSSGVLYRQATYSGDANNFPDTSNCVAQTINAGQLSASIVSATLAPVGYSNFGVVNNGTLVISVADDRDTGDGWSVLISASDFVYSGTSSNGFDIPASAFSITATGSPVVIFGQAIGSGGPYVDANAVGSLDSIRTLLIAETGFGAGRYQLTSTIALSIPPLSQAGTYTAVLTISTSAAP